MVIIVSGLPGSGKSYFAQHLANKLGCIYLNSDQVRHVLHASGKYTPADKLIIYKEMLVQTTQALEENRDVVVDATFYNHSLREMFIRLAEGFHVPVSVIEIVADEDVIRNRLEKPRKHSEANYNVYETVRDEFEEITMPHLILDSSDNDLQAMLETAITYIQGERE